MSEIRLLKAHRRVSVRREDTNHRFGFCRHSCSLEASVSPIPKNGTMALAAVKTGEIWD